MRGPPAPGDARFPVRRRPLRRALAAGLAATVLVGGLSTLALVFDGLMDEIGPADVGIVLGSKVNPDGRVSSRLKARLDEALALYRRGLFPTIIVSGATGKEGFDEAVTMKAYLVAHGVPAGAILVDSAGVNTRATAINSARLMRSRGVTRAVAVTQYFHIPRTRMALKKAGVETVYTAHARHFDWRDFYSVPREVVGYVVYSLR